MSNLEKLYGSKSKWYKNRKEKLNELFISEFKSLPDYYFSSPGRIEVLGNHTDHNNGLVLVSAIDLDIFAGVKLNNLNQIRLFSEGYGNSIIDLNDLSVKENEYNTTSSLIRGIIFKYKELGYKTGGFDITTTSNIFKGAGLSTSAAFELLICEILNDLFNDDKISRIDMAKISKFSENVYFNKPCGLLDQMGISLGGFNFIDFKEPSNLKIDNFKFNLNNYRIVLVNTGGSHGNLTKNYALIKEDMKKVSNLFNKETLREVDENEFFNNIALVKKKCGGRALIRAIHYFDENTRVLNAFNALKTNNTKEFLNMVNSSGSSSQNLLENCYIEKDNKQGIQTALALSKRIIKDGAVRVHGGGFKGTIIAYVSIKEQLEYINTMKKVFGERNVYKVELRELGVSRVIE